jgi:hypothetical protein
MPSDIPVEYYVTLALWAGVLAYLLASAWGGRRPVAGLALSYWCQLAVIHLLGGLIQLLPWHEASERPNTLHGFPLTGFAMAGFLVGQYLLRSRPVPPLPPPPHRPLPVDRRTVSLAQVSVVLGLAGFLGTSVLSRFLPGIGAVVGSSLNLAVAGFCLLWWSYYRSGWTGQAWRRLAWAGLIPPVLVLVSGFLGYAVTALITLGAFVIVFYQARLTTMLAVAFAAFFGLSLFNSYIAARRDIRNAVWGGRGLEDRLAVTTSSLQERWTWFDLGEQEQLDFIELRLNQNYLVGIARRRVEAQIVPLADGETIRDAALAVIPRLLWPDKPVFAGSGNLVSRFTGMRFDSSTSVGIGHVMELYVNFGEYGVLIGYILIGGALAYLDSRAALRLRAGDTEGFLLFFLMGQTMLFVGGNFAEMTAAALGSVILCVLFTRYLFPAWVRRRGPALQYRAR